MTEKINNNEIKEENIINDSKFLMKEKKKHIIKPILLKQKLKQHHFPNLIQIKNRKKIIIIQF